jgi:hypothetical protein
LFGFVGVSAIFVFAAGGLIVDDLQERATVDTAQRTMDVFDDRVTQVAATTEPADVPFDDLGAGDPTVTDGSTVAVSIDGCDRTVRRSLNAVEYDVDSQALVYEGGGIWKHTAEGPVVREMPPLDYDRTGGEPVFSMRLTNVGVTDPGRAGTDVSFDESATEAFQDDLDAMLEACAPQGTDLVVTVESEARSRAWATAFEETLDPDQFSEVSVSHAGSTATATIRGLVENDSAGSEGSVTVPAGTVTISILGTEASLHRTGDGECESTSCDKGWLPVTATVLFDGESVHRFPADASQSGDRTLDHNLNTPADHGSVVQFSTEVDESTSVTLESSLYACEAFGFDTGYTDAPDVTGGPWDDKRCTGGLAADPMVTVDPIENPDEPNIVALRDGDVVKTLEQPGVGQTSVNEMLEEKIDSETGELDLGDNQAIFLGELTESDASYDDVDPDDTGDPNFNDLVVLVETSPDATVSTTGAAVRVSVDHVVID